jgi:hypothetical protein
MPEGAVYVGRPSRWGNPHFSRWSTTRPQRAVAAFRSDLRDHEARDAAAFDRWLAPLRGHDLACWCPLDQPCHADVLLELANR